MLSTLKHDLKSFGLSADSQFESIVLRGHKGAPYTHVMERSWMPPLPHDLPSQLPHSPKYKVFKFYKNIATVIIDIYLLLKS